VIAPAFNPGQMVKLEEEVRGRARMLFDALPLGDTFDWVEQLAIPQTLGMLCSLFGISFDEWRDRRTLVGLWERGFGGQPHARVPR